MFEKLWLISVKTFGLDKYDVVKTLLVELANPPIVMLAKLNTKVPKIIMAATTIAATFAFLMMKSLDTLNVSISVFLTLSLILVLFCL